MLFKLLPILVVVALAHCRATDDIDTQALGSIVGKEPTGGVDKPTEASVENPTEEFQECELQDGQKGECVPYYLCKSNYTVIAHASSGVIDIGLHDDPCESYIDTCCQKSAMRPMRDIPIKLEQPKREGCGWRNPDGAGFLPAAVFNDGEAKFGEFPWTCAILKTTPVDAIEPGSQKIPVFIGGGSLIHPSVVLTAAHFVAKENDLRVRAGEWDTQTTKEIYPFQDRDVASVVVHEDFNAGTLFYDIAIVFLAQPMDLAPNVGMACLPPPKMSTPDGTRCFATGWGKDKFGKEGRYQVILKKVEVPVVGNKKCQEQLRETRLGENFQLHSSFMCAGGEEGVDTCQGDGGAPLSCPIETEPGRYMQSGIVAWSVGCGGKGVPGVHVDVAKLREWIDDKVVGKGYDHRVYSYTY